MINKATSDSSFKKGFSSSSSSGAPNHYSSPFLGCEEAPCFSSTSCGPFPPPPLFFSPWLCTQCRPIRVHPNSPPPPFCYSSGHFLPRFISPLNIHIGRKRGGGGFKKIRSAHGHSCSLFRPKSLFEASIMRRAFSWSQNFSLSEFSRMNIVECLPQWGGGRGPTFFFFSTTFSENTRKLLFLFLLFLRNGARLTRDKLETTVGRKYRQARRLFQRFQWPETLKKFFYSLSIR